MLKNLYDELKDRYDEVISIARKYISVYEFDTSKTNVNQIIREIERLNIVKTEELER